MKTLAYIGGALGAAAVGAIGYKKVNAIRTGVDKAHDVAVNGVTAAFAAMRKAGEAGSKAVEAHDAKRDKKTITVEAAK